jgi:hypothetical protein
MCLKYGFGSMFSPWNQNNLRCAMQIETMGQFALDAKLAHLNRKLNPASAQNQISSTPSYQAPAMPSKASKTKILSTLAKLNARLAAQMQRRLTGQTQLPGDNLMTPHFVEALQDAAANMADPQGYPPNYAAPTTAPYAAAAPYPAAAPYAAAAAAPYAAAAPVASYTDTVPTAPYAAAAPAAQYPSYNYAAQQPAYQPAYVAQAAQPSYAAAPAAPYGSAAAAPAAADGAESSLSSYDQQILAQGPPPESEPSAEPASASPQPAYAAPAPAYAGSYAPAAAQYGYPAPAAYSPQAPAYGAPAPAYAAPATYAGTYAAPAYSQPAALSSAGDTPADAEPCVMCVHGGAGAGDDGAGAGAAPAAQVNWQAPDTALKAAGSSGPLNLRAGGASERAKERETESETQTERGESA